MSHARRADRLLIKPTAGARPASPRTLGRFIPKTRKRGLTPDESRATRTPTSLATAPDGPTHRLSQTLEAVASDSPLGERDCGEHLLRVGQEGRVDLCGRELPLDGEDRFDVDHDSFAVRVQHDDPEELA